MAGKLIQIKGNTLKTMRAKLTHTSFTEISKSTKMGRGTVSTALKTGWMTPETYQRLVAHFGVEKAAI